MVVLSFPQRRLDIIAVVIKNISAVEIGVADADPRWSVIFGAQFHCRAIKGIDRLAVGGAKSKVNGRIAGLIAGFPISGQFGAQPQERMTALRGINRPIEIGCRAANAQRCQACVI